MNMYLPKFDIFHKLKQTLDVLIFFKKKFCPRSVLNFYQTICPGLKYFIFTPVNANGIIGKKCVNFKVESWYIALFVISGSIKKLIFFNIFCQYLFFLNIFFNIFCSVEKCGVIPHWLYRDLLTLIL